MNDLPQSDPEANETLANQNITPRDDTSTVGSGSFVKRRSKWPILLVVIGVLLVVWWGNKKLFPSELAEDPESESKSVSVICPIVSSDIAAAAIAVERDGKEVCGLDVSGRNYDHLTEGISFITTLKYLDVSNNSLREVPSWINQLVDLRLLDVSHNSLSRLPDELGALSRLERLILRGNPLPDEEINKIRQKLPQTTIEF